MAMDKVIVRSVIKLSTNTNLPQILATAESNQTSSRHDVLQGLRFHLPRIT